VSGGDDAGESGVWDGLCGILMGLSWWGRGEARGGWLVET
jgi:hypothetical protein